MLAQLLGPAASRAMCAIHQRHEPVPAYTELHHYVPQAWQVAWQPEKPWPDAGPSPDRSGVTLWDARTIALCRTGHGNVHYWLVAAMREINQLTAFEPTPAVIELAWHKVKQDARAPARTQTAAEVLVAQQAIRRYTDAGGPLGVLIAHRLWGQI